MATAALSQQRALLARTLPPKKKTKNNLHRSWLCHRSRIAAPAGSAEGRERLQHHHEGARPQEEPPPRGSRHLPGA